MMGFPSRATVERIKKNYPVGCRVQLVEAEEDCISPGALGTVTDIDDIGTISVAWDCGKRYRVVFGADYCVRVD